MTKLFRKISDSSKWAGYEEHKAWADNDCPGEMLNELYDSRGISVWDVGLGAPDDILRLCAVLCFGMTSVPEQYCGVVFDSSLVSKAGMKLSASNAKEMCETVSKAHYDITSVTTVRFARWAKDVLRDGDLIVLSREKILDRMAALQSQNELKDGLPSKHQDLLPFLWKRNRLFLSTLAIKN